MKTPPGSDPERRFLFLLHAVSAKDDLLSSLTGFALLLDQTLASFFSALLQF